MGVANGGDLTLEVDGFGQDSDALGFAQAPAYDVGVVFVDKSLCA